MSFSRHAYKHALQQRPISQLDHVWISDECLAGAFQRFLKCQRRHESRVPGPLEANRRLAKRKNTALARTGSAYGPTIDVGNLFGVNGSGHIRQRDDLPWTRSWPEPLGLPPESPKPLSPGAATVDVLPPTQSNTGSFKISADEKTFDGSLGDCRSLEDVRKIVYRLQIDLNRDLTYSHMIFNHLSSRSISSPDSLFTFDELVQFLNDQTLNTTGAGNYQALVEHLTNHEVDAIQRDILLGAVARGVELGLVPGSELENIIRRLPDVRSAGNKLRYSGNSRELTNEYRRIWEALRSCSVLRLRDLQRLLDAWFAELLAEKTPFEDSLLLAKELATAYHESIPAPSHWIPVLIYQCLRLPVPSTLVEASSRDRQKVIAHITDFLCQLDPELASGYIIHISESLTFSQKDDEQRHDMLSVWRECLESMSNAESFLSSRVWTEISRINSPQGKELDCAARHQIALRVWILSALRRRLRAKSPPWRLQPLATDNAMVSLLKQFPLYTWDGHKPEFFFSNLTRAIQQLNVPCNHVLLITYALLTNKPITNHITRLAFEKLERSEMTLKDAAAHGWSFNSTKKYLFASHVQMIGRIDVTNSDFAENMIHMVEQNPVHMHQLFRLLYFHLPLKTALVKAWRTDSKKKLDSKTNLGADPRLEQTRTTPDMPATSTTLTSAEADNSRKSEKKMRAYPPIYLHPEACLGLIHLFAIRFAMSKSLKAKKAYRIVQWLHNFLITHHAPIRPSLARALYHCGVVRFHREGRRISKDQFSYIMKVVRQFEDPEITKALDDGVDLDIELKA